MTSLERVSREGRPKRPMTIEDKKFYEGIEKKFKETLEKKMTLVILTAQTLKEHAAKLAVWIENKKKIAEEANGKI